MEPPTISIAALVDVGASHEARASTLALVVDAVRTWGFFHAVDHGLPATLQQALRREARAFFALPVEAKRTIARSPANARGFADDELTKQKTDAKQLWDVGHRPFPLLADDDAANSVLDGHNQWPPADLLPSFRGVVEEWYARCAALGATLATALGASLGDSSADLLRLSEQHTSFLRLNFYPTSHAAAERAAGEAVLGISRHTDAGLLTILAQDEDANALEVYSGTKQAAGDGAWVPVRAVRGALTINTGDLLQVLSNGRYKAPEHRVRKSVGVARYSEAFFFNPSYDASIAPLPGTGAPLYRPFAWGEFRRRRFEGDVADKGVEAQIEDYLI